MKALLIAVVCWLAASSAHACTAFYQSESVSGMNKICYYTHLGSTVAITVSSVKLCPLSINWSH